LTTSKFKRKIYALQKLEIVGLACELQRKKVKRLTLKIDNKNAQLKVVAPINLSEKTIHEFVASKKIWIVKNQQKVLNQIHMRNIEFVDGDHIKFLGEKLQLKLLFNALKPQIKLIKNHNLINNSYQSDLFIGENSNTHNTDTHIIAIDSQLELNRQQKQLLLEKFYRIELQKIINNLVPKWQEIMGLNPSFVGIKKMHTRHGSCNARAKRIWLSLNLIHHSLDFIEYVIVHEFVHFLVPNHGKKFYEFMDKFLPTWKLIRKSSKI